MKKIQALILDTCRSSGGIVGGTFLGIAIVTWCAVALIPSAARSGFFMSSFGFFFLAVLGIPLFAHDQFTGALVLPISGQEFVIAKILCLSALLAAVSVLLSATLWGISAVYDTAWSIMVFYLPAAFFPVSCIISMLFVVLMLSGKPAVLLGLWIIVCSTPGITGSFMSVHMEPLYKGISAVLCALPTQYHAVLLIALYGGCAGLMFVLYKLGVRNFNRLQYSRFLSGSQKT